LVRIGKLDEGVKLLGTTDAESTRQKIETLRWKDERRHRKRHKGARRPAAARVRVGKNRPAATRDRSGEAGGSSYGRSENFATAARSKHML